MIDFIKSFSVVKLQKFTESKIDMEGLLLWQLVKCVQI